MEVAAGGLQMFKHDALVIAVLGLGEAGSALARDLAAVGASVRGWDPVVKDVPTITMVSGIAEAVPGAQLILSVNAASVALDVARDSVPYLGPGQIFADLNTAAPALKESLHHVIQPTGALFADVALMAPVPGRGLKTPSLVSGPGARRYAELLSPLGAPVHVVDERPGSAAARKLLRSVFMKGLAAAVLEGLAAAERMGWGDWYREEVARTLTESDAALVDRLIQGSRRHARRRVGEMLAAAELLLSVGVTPRVALASADLLRDLERETG